MAHHHEHVFRSARNVWRLAPLHVRSERSPLHDVRQHAHANGAWTRRIACANSFFTDEYFSQPTFVKAFGGQPSRFEGWLAEPKPQSGEGWWSQTESNRRPPACKAGALPTELWPLVGGRPPSPRRRRATFAVRRLACQPKQPLPQRLVGLGRFELPTSRLSSARSNQLSYRPKLLAQVTNCTL